jgi:hypothetical protein
MDIEVRVFKCPVCGYQKAERYEPHVLATGHTVYKKYSCQNIYTTLSAAEKRARQNPTGYGKRATNRQIDAVSGGKG